MQEHATLTVRLLTVARDVLACMECSTLHCSQVSCSTAVQSRGLVGPEFGGKSLVVFLKAVVVFWHKTSQRENEVSQRL